MTSQSFLSKLENNRSSQDKSELIKVENKSPTKVKAENLPPVKASAEFKKQTLSPNEMHIDPDGTKSKLLNDKMEAM